MALVVLAHMGAATEYTMSSSVREGDLNSPPRFAAHMISQISAHSITALSTA